MDSETSDEEWRDPGLTWTQLRAFEACARLSAFNAAAGMLDLTPAAVRHQVALLEARLGVQLFYRNGGRLALTVVGTDFARGIARPIRDLVDACTVASGVAANAPLTLTAPPLFARQFLLDRAFLKWCEANAVHLDVTDAKRNLLPPNQIAAIRLGAEPDPELMPTPLLNARLGLAAAPVLAAKARPRDPKWWSDQVLLSPSISTRGWPLLWRALRLGPISPRSTLHFTSYAAAIEEASMGRGLILAPLNFAQNELSSGRLKLISDRRIASRIGFALVMQRSLAVTAKGRALRRKIVSITKERAAEVYS